MMNDELGMALRAFYWQGLSLLLAMILKALGPHQYYDGSDDEYAPDRVPLLKNASHPPYVVVDPAYGSKNDWNR